MKTTHLYAYLSIVLYALLQNVIAQDAVTLFFSEPTGFSSTAPHATLEWTAEPGKTYLIQSADSLSSSTEWTTEEPVTQTKSSVGPIRWMAPEAIQQQQFYRLIPPQTEVLSLEPAFIDSGDTNALFYLVGQCLPTNGFIVINGQMFTPVQSDSNGTWVAVSLNSLSPGTTISGTVQVLDGGSNVVAELPVDYPVYYGTAPSDEQLQGPPEEPPASPQMLAFWLTKKGYDYYKSKGQMTGVKNNPMFKRGTPSTQPIYDHDADGYLGKASYGGQLGIGHPKFDAKTRLLQFEIPASNLNPEQSQYQLSSGYDLGDCCYDPCCDGGIISPPTGEFQFQATDLAIPGRCMDFAWTRTYRSRTGSSSPMGQCWDHAFNISLEEQPDGTIQLCDGSGRCDTFYPDGTNGWLRAERFERIADLNMDGMPDVLFADGSRWLFNPDGVPARGKVALIEDMNGNAISLNYDGAGRLDSIVDDLGRTNSIAYNVAGLIESVTDFTGRSVTYQYDGDSNLTAVVSPPVTGTPNGNDFPGGLTNQYTYTSGHVDERLNHNLTSIIDGKGQTQIQIVYSSTNNPVSLDFDTAISLLRGIEKTDIRRGMVIAKPGSTTPHMKVVVNDYVGNVTETEYDLRYRPVEVREFTGRADPTLPTTSTENRPTVKLRSSDPDYFETKYEWNPDSLCTRILYPAGNSTEFVYQRAFNQSTSFNDRAHAGDLRILRQRPCCDTDDDGDGVPDTIEERFEYDPRFGSPLCGITDWNVGDWPIFNGTLRGESGGDFLMGNLGVCGDLDFCTSHLDPRGNVTTAEYDTAGRIIRRTHFKEQVEAVYDESFAYNEYGQLTAITNAADANGFHRVDTFEYYTNGPSISRIAVANSDATGGNLVRRAYEYDDRGNVTRYIDPNTNDWLFTYNQLDQCVQAESAPYGTGSSGTGGRVVVAYGYDSNKNPVQMDVSNLDETANPVTGNPEWTTTYAYDARNRLILVSGQVGTGSAGALFVTNRFIYDGNDNLVASLSPMAVSGLDPDNLVTNLYDERGLLFQTTAAPGTADESTDQFDYDANGWVRVRCIHKDSVEDFSRYTARLDGFSRCIAIQDAMGNTTTFGYDRSSNLIRAITEGELADEPGTNSNVRLAETSYTYDALDRCVQQVDSFSDIWTGTAIDDGARTTTWAYAPNGQCISVTDDNGHATTYDYDTVGRLASVTDAKGNVVSYAYDNNGNVVSDLRSDISDITPALQEFSTTYEYDALDRLIRSVDNVGNTNLFAYDSRNHLVVDINPRENATLRVYDGLGHCIATTNYEGTSRTITISTSHTEYNSNGRCIASTDANGNITQYDYDSLDRCTQVTKADGTPHVFVWNTRGDLASSTDANGTVVDNSYDLLGRLLGRIIVPGSGVSSSTTFEEYAYDGLSRLVYASNDVSRLDFAYDSLGNCVEQLQDGFSTIASHDAVGNRLAVVHPSGRQVAYTYNALDDVETISSSGGGYPSALIASYEYDGPGRVGRITRDNNVNTRVQWDGLVSPANATGDYGWQQVSGVSHKQGGAVFLDQRTAAYDRNQNRVLREQTTPFFAGGPTTTNLFEYDAVDRLTGFTRETGSVDDLFKSHQLDAQGNRTATITNGVAGFYTMDSTFPDPADFQVNQYTLTPYVLAPELYDENGNLISRLRAAGNWGYVYDYADRLVEVWDLSTGLAELAAEYSYDPLGRRIGKIVYPLAPATPTATYYVYDGGNVIEERDEYGVIGKSFILDGSQSQDDGVIGAYRWTQVRGPFVSPSGGNRLVMSTGGQDYYYLSDDLGNVLALADSSGNVVERYDFDDFGAPHFLSADGFDLGTNASAFGNTVLFGGMEWDPETGFYYGHSQGGTTGPSYTDPETGRPVSSVAREILYAAYKGDSGVPVASAREIKYGAYKGDSGIPFTNARELKYAYIKGDVVDVSRKSAARSGGPNLIVPVAMDKGLRFRAHGVVGSTNPPFNAGKIKGKSGGASYMQPMNEFIIRNSKARVTYRRIPADKSQFLVDGMSRGPRLHHLSPWSPDSVGAGSISTDTIKFTAEMGQIHAAR